MKILVIEDDPTVGQYVKRGLEEQRWGVDLVTDGEEGERRAAAEQYDLVVLDMRLPGRSGMEVLRQASKGLPRQAGRILRHAMRLAVPKGLNHLPDDLLQQAIEELR